MTNYYIHLKCIFCIDLAVLNTHHSCCTALFKARFVLNESLLFWGQSGADTLLKMYKYTFVMVFK